jgi:hypothetical protein
MDGIDMLARQAFMNHFANGWITPSYLRVLTDPVARNGTERAIRSYQQQSCRLLDLT